jgi:hypothetical protein
VHTIVVAIWWRVFIFIFYLIIYISPLDYVNVIETSINFAEIMPVQFLSVDDGRRCWNHKFFCFHTIKMSHFRITASNVGFPQPSNPPLMTDEEKEEATTRHDSHPPLCKCRYRSQLVNPMTGLDYTLF